MCAQDVSPEVLRSGKLRGAFGDGVARGVEPFACEVDVALCAHWGLSCTDALDDELLTLRRGEDHSGRSLEGYRDVLDEFCGREKREARRDVFIEACLVCLP